MYECIQPLITAVAPNINSVYEQLGSKQYQYCDINADIAEQDHTICQYQYVLISI